MSLFLVTAPTFEPITLVDAKLHLKVEHTTDDDLIDALIRAAREHVETYTGRAIVSQTWDLKLDSWTSDRQYYDAASDGIWLPKPPTASVTSVTYVDGAGDSQTWTAGSTGYLTDLPTGPQAGKGRIYPAYAISYPTLRSQTNAVTIRFVAGLPSASILSVPYGLIAGIKLLLTHWYYNREPTVVGNIVSKVPMAVDALLWPYKVF